MTATVSRQSTISQAIDYLRLPLMGGVVFIHCILHNVVVNGTQLVSSEHLLYNIVHHLLTDEIARIAVPLFFFFSGYLFFSSGLLFTRMEYLNKLKKRARTLLIPYLFWNIVVVVLFLALQLFLPQLTSGANKPILDYTFSDWVNTMWSIREGEYPINIPLWFIRDLFMMIILSPIFHVFLRYSKNWGIVLLGILWLSNIQTYPGFSLAAIFFFTFGGWFRMYGHDFALEAMKIRSAVGSLYVLLLITNTALWYHHAEVVHAYMHNLGILVGMATTIGWTAYGLASGRLHTNTTLSNSSFFIYAYHGIWIALLCKLWVKFIPVSTGTLLLGYFLLPLVIISIGVGGYILLRRWFPTFTAWITGGR